MKKRKSKAYLIVSSAHLGIDDQVLGVFAEAAKYYKAQPIHLGALCDDKSFRRHETMSKRLAVCESEVKSEQLQGAVDELEDAQDESLSKLVEALGHIQVVTTEKSHLPIRSATKKRLKLTYGGINLSRLLFLSPVQPSGDRSVMNQMPGVSIRPLKQVGRNWIAPHPVPSVGAHPHPGLNQTYNYWTVGSLRAPEYPTHTRDQYQFSHMPAAIMLIVDTENGEFHAKHLHIDYRPSDGAPMILDDGLVFTNEGWSEVGSSDRMMFITDAHAPHTHFGTLGAFRGVAQMFEPETVVDGGDAADFESANRHAKGMPGYTEGLRVVNDLQNLQHYLGAISLFPFVKRRVLIDSNHHDWLTLMVNENPALIGMLDWKTLARDWYQDWEVLLRGPGENVIYYFGDLMVRHGDQESLKGGEGLSPSGKYICGHHHWFMSWRRANQIGCAAKLGPAYTKNQVNRWQSQIATATKCEEITGTNPKIILHDKQKPVSRVAFRNTIYEIDHHKLNWAA